MGTSVGTHDGRPPRPHLRRCRPLGIRDQQPGRLDAALLLAGRLDGSNRARRDRLAAALAPDPRRRPGPALPLHPGPFLDVHLLPPPPPATPSPPPPPPP